jgi:hypothetical protein
MKRPDHHAALHDEFARFQAEIRRIALDAARALVNDELERRRSRLRGRPGSAVATRTAPPVAGPSESAPPAPAPSAAAAPPPPLPTPGERKGRITWTRESVISELASWMTSGTSIDAAFITRYGPPGLVAATRRIFGRFDAALNVAGLHLSKLYPDGPPQR